MLNMYHSFIDNKQEEKLNIEIMIKKKWKTHFKWKLLDSKRLLMNRCIWEKISQTFEFTNNFISWILTLKKEIFY